MEINEAYQHLESNLDTNPGRFFSYSKDLSLGTGVIYQGIRYPIYDESRAIFQTATGFVLVLTHECDVDQNNARIFNDHALICPLIKFDIFVENYSSSLGSDLLKSFLANLGRRRISRVLYTPPFDGMPFGSLLYLNQITSTHISTFKLEQAEQLCTVTAHGLAEIDNFLKNHLLRPKTERLPLDDSRSD